MVACAIAALGSAAFAWWWHRSAKQIQPKLTHGVVFHRVSGDAPISAYGRFRPPARCLWTMDLTIRNECAEDLKNVFITFNDDPPIPLRLCCIAHDSPEGRGLAYGDAADIKHGETLVICFGCCYSGMYRSYIKMSPDAFEPGWRPLRTMTIEWKGGKSTWSAQHAPIEGR